MPPTSSSYFLHFANELLHFRTAFVTLSDKSFTKNKNIPKIPSFQNNLQSHCLMVSKSVCLSILSQQWQAPAPERDRQEEAWLWKFKIF